MARVLVLADAPGGPVVEIVTGETDEGEARFGGRCDRPGCTWSMPERPQQRFEDAVREAEIHVDQCVPA